MSSLARCSPTPITKSPPSGSRRAYIDVARGLAVLLMIEAHTIDAWTRAASKNTIAFRNATVLGGFAAPLFLWLAGVAMVLAAERTVQKTGDRRAGLDAVVRRGLEIFILAFLFRIQAFVLSPGGPAIALFRVDILNVMGPAIVAAGVCWAVVPRAAPRAAVFAGAAAAVAMVTPIVRTAHVVGALPTWLQWYVRPAGEHTTFTLFPWAAFVFAGAAVGTMIAACQDRRHERALQVWVGLVGAVTIAFAAFASTQPSIYREAYFWTSSPAWFAMRVGILMVALASLYSACSNSPENLIARSITTSIRVFVLSWRAPLERLGRSSLFIYWIHVELVYGYASWLWRGRLPLWGTALAYLPFVAAMYGLLVLRDRMLENRPAPAPARAYTSPTGHTGGARL